MYKYWPQTFLNCLYVCDSPFPSPYLHLFWFILSKTMSSCTFIKNSLSVMLQWQEEHAMMENIYVERTIVGGRMMRSYLYDCNFACASLFAGKLLSAAPRDGLGESMVPIFPHGAPLGAACSCAVISILLLCYCVFPAGGRIPACNETHRKLLARRTAVAQEDKFCRCARK